MFFNDYPGNEIELEVVDYFDYENEEYAVMIDPAAVDDDERDLFVFRIQVNGEYEEFLPAGELRGLLRLQDRRLILRQTWLYGGRLPLFCVTPARHPPPLLILLIFLFHFRRFSCYVYCKRISPYSPG